MDLAVLLSMPVESIAVRAILATVACVALVRLLLHAGLRSPRARVATALAPAGAIVAVVLLTASSPRLPILMMPVDAAGALPIRVPDGYVHFAPMAGWLLVGLWASIGGVRIGRRAVRRRRAHRAARVALEAGPAPARVAGIAREVACALAVTQPRVAVAGSCPGGAMVVGSRRPIIVVGEELAEQLDDAELEGVLAHELAHVKRRDNLVAGALGSLRDLAFFVPGVGWAVRHLHRERELAADQVAVAATRRPGALASGLLKVIEGGPDHRHACAALAPSGTLVDRVRVLVDDAPPPSRVRRGSETIAVAAVVASATAAALVIPAAIAGPEREREAMALVWSSTSAAEVEATAASAEARAFSVYRRSELGTDEPSSAPLHSIFDERSQENRRGTLHACGDEGGNCPVPPRSPSLGLRAQPTLTVDSALVSQWQATPVVGADSSDGLRLYWLSRRAE